MAMIQLHCVQIVVLPSSSIGNYNVKMCTFRSEIAKTPMWRQSRQDIFAKFVRWQHLYWRIPIVYGKLYIYQN